jgi:hypothetical protein
MSKKPGAASKRSKPELADDALWSAYCDACYLHNVQTAVNNRFDPGKRTGEWQYRPQLPLLLEATDWKELVGVLARFRVSLAAVVAALPNLRNLMDAPSQAIPDRWTFRVRLELAELESLYSHEVQRRALLKIRKEPEDDAGKVLMERPMDEVSLRRFGELLARLKMRCAEVAFAIDPNAVWRDAGNGGRERRDKDADESAVKSALGRLLAKNPDRNKITLVRLERESQVPDHAVQQTRAWAEHMKKRTGKGALPNHRKAEDPADAAIAKLDWDAFLRRQEAEKKSRY